MLSDQNAKVRLISPQRLSNSSQGLHGHYEGNDQYFRLCFDNGARLTLDYDPCNHLPVGNATVGCSTPDAVKPLANLSLLNEDNQNITAGHKLLLDWHARFGHLNFPSLQAILRRFPFTIAKFSSASKFEVADFKGAECQFAKGHCRSTKGKVSSSNIVRDGALRDNHLRPGTCVSVDHFEACLLGQTFDSYGKPTSDQYKGGCIFVDHSSGILHVEHQLGFSAVETIRAKNLFESMAFDNGVVIDSYLTDSGAFKALEFVQIIRESGQKIQFCGLNAHHQSGIAEHSIRTISNMSRALLLHASAHWPCGIDSSLWPMAVTYATYIYNRTPNEHHVCPANIFTESTIPRQRLRDLHTWGCPLYALDPRRQGGKKLPRWEPRTRHGVFIGLSTAHSSEVLALNLQTGSITTQYHVVFDDGFTTVESIAREDDPPSFWDDLCLENTVTIPIDAPDPANPTFLADDWLSEADKELKYRALQHQERVRTALTTLVPTLVAPSVTPPPLSAPTPVHSHPSLELETVSTSEGAGDSTSEGASFPSSTLPPVILSAVSPSSPSTVLPPITFPVISSPPLRRSTRSIRGQPDRRYADEANSTYLDRPLSDDSQTQQLAYLAELGTCYNTGIENVTDPRVDAANIRHFDDPDTRTFHQAMAGSDSAEYLEAMQREIHMLTQQKTWTVVPRTSDMNVLESTWAFKLKRLSYGTVYRHKARFCARGDLQKEGVDFFDTYAPVVQWSTIRLLLTTVLTENWTTRQVDYTNAFAQAFLNENVYIECPKLFGPKSGKSMVLHLNKSLYGLRQAPRTFYEKLRAGLLERGFVQSDFDPCLFLKDTCLCVIYVDDTIFAGPDGDVVEGEISSLGVDDKERRHTFQLRNEGEVGAFLGIQITSTGSNQIYLTQTGLIEKALRTAGMTDCNGIDTPTHGAVLGSDLSGPAFSEPWSYRSIVGMLMYLAANTRPDIACAVHQAARFSHSPKQSHGSEVKSILRYLKSTQDKGLYLNPTDANRVDCYVDSDFAGQFPVEDPNNPISARSRTSYVIIYRGCPILWVPKLQSQIALSTMKAEYVAISSSMRDLIPIRGALTELYLQVVDTGPPSDFHTFSKAFHDVDVSPHSGLPPSTVFEDNHACLKFARTGQLSPRTKHIGIPYHWFRAQVTALNITIESVSTHDNLADQFTKGLVLEKNVVSRFRLMGW